VRKVTQEQLRMLFMAAEAVTASATDGSVRLAGNRYWSEELAEVAGQKVILRVDPQHLHGGASVYALDGTFIAEAPCVAAVGFADSQAAREHSRAKKNWRSARKQQLDAERRMDAAEVAAQLPTPPPETLRGAPLRPWTIPNAIGYLRLALLVAFIAVAAGHPQSIPAAALLAAVAWGDQLDGVAARVTGQYSRLGTLLDPVIDRLLVLAAMAVCFRFDLLPRWAIALLAFREVLMLAVGQYWIRRGIELRINWFGRWAVWPTMLAPFLAILEQETAGAVFLYIGLVLAFLATAAYARDGIRAVRAERASSAG
jgi:cardiolipin synthase